MAPKQSKKRKSASMDSDSISRFPSPPKGFSPARSAQDESMRPPSKRARIGFEERQQLIDNLQLEITNRARRLRAQYHAQAQAMRTRLQIRTARIPSNMRKITMGELAAKWREIGTRSIDKTLQTAKTSTEAVAKAEESRATASSEQQRPQTATTNASAAISLDQEDGFLVAKTRTNKRKSKHIYEDEPFDFKVKSAPIRRTRIDAAPVGPASGPGRRLSPSRILSPKSNNSRTFPQSPFKSLASPTRNGLARPTSPSKPGSSAVSAAPTASSLAKNIDRPKGGPAPSKSAGRKAVAHAATSTRTQTTVGTARVPRSATRTSNRVTKTVKNARLSDTSTATTTSSGTTIIKKSAPTSSKSTTASASAKASAKRSIKTVTASTKADETKGNGPKKVGHVGKTSNLTSKAAGTNEGRSLRARAR